MAGRKQQPGFYQQNSGFHSNLIYLSISESLPAWLRKLQKTQFSNSHH